MTPRQRMPVLAAVAALMCTGTALIANPSVAALAAAAGPSRPATTFARAASQAGFGPNLLRNAGAQAGASAVNGWDAVTIPGWQITAGLPTVVRYGTTHFPPVTGQQPAVRGGQMFAGGAGGTARLQQTVSLRLAGGRLVPAGTRFQLAAWLGGTRKSKASVQVTFLSAAGREIGREGIGPVGGPAPLARPARRSVTGTVPAGAATARVTLLLATSLTNYDGPDAPLVGYNRAVADDLLLRVSAPVHAQLLTPPASDTPRYQHVFLFYFENEDYDAVIGNTRQAPFLNSLLPHASVLADFFAEEHPSDANYLALAGGSAFGVPLDDPLEENPQYTIRARNISDLIGDAHETWKAYLQSADGPCDDTVHGYYWDDDMPMTYFADVRDRPAFCAAHIVPLQALDADLAHADTTPNFAWVSPDDCADMEGCGIKAGDEFLATELGDIMRSPAWRTQRSLAIITFDEDGYDYEHPAQRVATIIIGSRGVRRGYVSRVRYTHYSLLRTIEAALGLGTLTANDRYAQPVNDVFLHGRAAASANSALLAVRRRAAGKLAIAAAAPGAGAVLALANGRPAHPTAFVVNSASNSVTPVDLVTRRAGNPIRVGTDPVAVAVSPSGAMAYVVNSGSGTVTPIATAARKAGKAIRVGTDPQGIAITPDGKTAYVTNMGSDTVTPIDLATRDPGAPIAVGAMPRAIAITPDGRTALVLNWGGGSVTPIRLASGRLGPRSFGRAGRAIAAGSYPFSISIAPDGVTAYVAGYGSDTVTPINALTLRADSPVAVGQAPDALAVTPDSSRVYVVNGDSETLTVMPAARSSLPPAPPAAVRTVKVGYSPIAVGIAAPSRTAFVVNTISGTVTPVSLATGKAGRPILIGIYSYPTAIEMAAAGPTAVVVSPYAGQVTLLNTSTRKAIATVNVGSYPVAAAITP